MRHSQIQSHCSYSLVDYASTRQPLKMFFNVETNDEHRHREPALLSSRTSAIVGSEQKISVGSSSGN